VTHIQVLTPQKADVASYRIYLMGLDGYLFESTIVNCKNDKEALSKATEMLQTFDAAVEVWDGPRKVGHIQPTPDSPGGE
jgi:hypothetical protein